jgi:hypothetical protein
VRKAKALSRGHRAWGPLAAAIAIAGLAACSNARAASQDAAIVFPFGDSLWKFAVAAGAPERLKKLQGASFARCWEGSGGKGGALIAADVRGGRLLSLTGGSEPRSLYSGAWSWAGAGEGLVAVASREYREGFEFRVISRASEPAGEIKDGIRLDCFVSDALFLRGKVLVAGANGSGASFAVWELEPSAGSSIRPLTSLPRDGGFLRLAGAEDGPLYCFVSARSSDAAGPLSIWRLLPTASAKGAEARPIEPRFSSEGALAWFGAGWLDGPGRLAMPLSLRGGKYALSLIGAGTGIEERRIELPAPLYQHLASRRGIEYAILYDHAKAPGRFRIAAIDTEKGGASVFDMP